MNLMKSAFLAGGLMVGSFSGAWADQGARISQCMVISGEKYQIHPYLLWSIAKTESDFNPNAMGLKNKNKSYDIGLMQINSWWLPTLAKHGITEKDLMDPCVSIDVGAWVLANNFKRLGVNWRAVGAYNATTEWKRTAYAKKVQKALAIAYRMAGKKKVDSKALVVADLGKKTIDKQLMRVVTE